MQQQGTGSLRLRPAAALGTLGTLLVKYVVSRVPASPAIPAPFPFLALLLLALHRASLLPAHGLAAAAALPGSSTLAVLCGPCAVPALCYTLPTAVIVTVADDIPNLDRAVGEGSQGPGGPARGELMGMGEELGGRRGAFVSTSGARTKMGPPAHGTRHGERHHSNTIYAQLSSPV